MDDWDSGSEQKGSRTAATAVRSSRAHSSGLTPGLHTNSVVTHGIGEEACRTEARGAEAHAEVRMKGIKVSARKLRICISPFFLYLAATARDAQRPAGRGTILRQLPTQGVEAGLVIGRGLVRRRLDGAEGRVTGLHLAADTGDVAADGLAEGGDVVTDLLLAGEDVRLRRGDVTSRRGKTACERTLAGDQGRLVGRDRVELQVDRLVGLVSRGIRVHEGRVRRRHHHRLSDEEDGEEDGDQADRHDDPGPHGNLGPLLGRRLVGRDDGVRHHVRHGSRGGRRRGLRGSLVAAVGDEPKSRQLDIEVGVDGGGLLLGSHGSMLLCLRSRSSKKEGL